MPKKELGNGNSVIWYKTTPFLIHLKFYSKFLFLFGRVFSQEIPTDVVVEVGEANFPLHKVCECLCVCKYIYKNKLSYNYTTK